MRKIVTCIVLLNILLWPCVVAANNPLQPIHSATSLAIVQRFICPTIAVSWCVEWFFLPPSLPAPTPWIICQILDWSEHRQARTHARRKAKQPTNERAWLSQSWMCVCCDQSRSCCCGKTPLGAREHVSPLSIAATFVASLTEASSCWYARKFNYAIVAPFCLFCNDLAPFFFAPSFVNAAAYLSAL